MTRPTLRISAIAALMLGTATPALAQDICGGFGNNGQWIGGDEANSDISTSATYGEQMALVLGGNEYVSLFTL
ncbi:MAG TPA: ABC transporter substrate-binding protein, partial [Yoonia sp.]|nr:ABC transporter substrate-binding protein [Yoonia sp.]